MKSVYLVVYSTRITSDLLSFDYFYIKMKPKAKQPCFLAMRISGFEFGMTIIISLMHLIIFYACLPREKLPIPQNFDIYPNCMPCPKYDNTTIYSSADDLLLVFNYDKSRDELSTFIYEVRSTGYMGRIVAFVDGDALKQNETLCGVEIVQTDKNIPSKVSPSFRKYFDAEKYLSKTGLYASRVLLANASRLFFLKDPFQLISNPSKVLLLENPVSLLPYGFVSGACANHWVDRPTYFESALIGGGQIQLTKFLKYFINDANVTSCYHTENDRIVLTNIAATKSFGSDKIELESLTAGNPDLSVDPEGFMIRTQFGKKHNSPNVLPTVIIDYQNSDKLVSSKQNSCTK